MTVRRCRCRPSAAGCARIRMPLAVSWKAISRLCSSVLRLSAIPRSGSPGSEGVPLTPEASIAVDEHLHPLGAPFFVSASAPDPDPSQTGPQPESRCSWHRIRVAPSKALRGPMCSGALGKDAAESIAGPIEIDRAKLFVLLPKAAGRAHCSAHTDFGAPMKEETAQRRRARAVRRGAEGRQAAEGQDAAARQSREARQGSGGGQTCSSYRTAARAPAHRSKWSRRPLRRSPASRTTRAGSPPRSARLDGSVRPSRAHHLRQRCAGARRSGSFSWSREKASAKISPMHPSVWNSRAARAAG